MGRVRERPLAPTQADIDKLTTAIDDVLGVHAHELVTEYCNEAGKFAATTFDKLADDDANEPDVIGRDDLLAVTMLNVYVPAPAVRNILSPAGTDAITQVLRPLPTNIDLWRAELEDLRKAEAAWKELGKRENAHRPSDGRQAPGPEAPAAGPDRRYRGDGDHAGTDKPVLGHASRGDH